MCADGKTERGVCRKVHAEANAWRAVGGGCGGPANLKKTKGQGHEHFCDTGMPARNGNFGTDRNTTTKASSVRKKLGTEIARVKRADRRRKVELRE